ncbi:MAG: hypothetical protein ABL900_07040 [Burkholderiaceae bacterium]
MPASTLPRCRGRLAGAALGLSCAVALAAQPAPGQYAAQWCVLALPNAQASCGPVQVKWRTAGHATVRISDIVYSLRLRTSQVDVVLKQGAMQIDGFTTTYEWAGRTLRFVDTQKNVHYELQTLAAPDRHLAPAPRR